MIFFLFFRISFRSLSRSNYLLWLLEYSRIYLPIVLSLLSVSRVVGSNQYRNSRLTARRIINTSNGTGIRLYRSVSMHLHLYNHPSPLMETKTLSTPILSSYSYRISNIHVMASGHRQQHNVHNGSPPTFRGYSLANRRFRMIRDINGPKCIHKRVKIN